MSGETTAVDNSARPVRLWYEDLLNYTDNFSKENYIGKFQFGKVYRGQIPALRKTVTVKIWETDTGYQFRELDNLQRLMDEVLLLQCEDLCHHQGLMKLYGYYFDSDDKCGVVYDYKPYGILCNLLHNDDFKWWQRIKVALGLAHLLKFLHASDHGGSPLIIRNFDVAHVLVDEDWNPKLYDFSMITGGIFPDRTVDRSQRIKGSHGFEEPCIGWCQKSDVYAFGVLLLCLMTNEYRTREDTLDGGVSIVDQMYDLFGEKSFWERTQKSWVVRKLRQDTLYYPNDGSKITDLAVSCLICCTIERPDIEDVVTCLQKLDIVRLHRHIFPWLPQSAVLKDQKKVNGRRRSRRSRKM